MSNGYEVRFEYNGPLSEEICNTKTVFFDTEESADGFYHKVMHHAVNRPRPLHGTVALWNGRWRIKCDSF